MPIVTPAELRDYLQIPYLPDAPLALAIAGVEGLVRGYTGRPLVAVENEVARLDGNGATSLLLPKLPVADVVGVVEDPDGYANVLALGTQIEWNEDGIVRRVDGGTFARRLRWYAITYDVAAATFDELAVVKLVVLRVCARAAVNPEGLSQESVTGYASTFGFDATRLATLTDPDKVDLDALRVTV